MTEAQVREKYVGILQRWVGEKESDGSFKHIIDTYNSVTPLPRGYRMTYKDPWCATTVSAAAIEAGLIDIIPRECSCAQMIAAFKRLGRWEENDAFIPKPGDPIFYSWKDDGKGDNTKAPDHVGVVEKVSGGNITVIEGNYNNSVRRRKIPVNGKYIRGFGRPDFASKASPEPVQPQDVGGKPRATVAQEVLEGRWGNGKERTDRLTAAGYNPAAIQEAVNILATGGTLPPEPTRKSVDEIAYEVLAGLWGNGPDRVARLTEAGYNPAEVQAKVNTLATQ